MSELLTAASLLLAVVGVFYGLWYSDIIRALGSSVPRHQEDRAKPRTDVLGVLTSKALPLVVVSTLTTLVFLPDVATIASNSLARLSREGLSRYIADYSSVTTAFSLVVVLTLAISVHSWVLFVRLLILLKRLSANSGAT